MMRMSPQSTRRRQMAAGTVQVGGGSDRRPPVFPAGRRCPCGSPLSIYNRGPLCSPCREGHRLAQPDSPIIARQNQERRAAAILSRFVENAGLVGS